MRRLLPLLTALAVALVGAAACGDDDPGGIATAGGTESTEAAGEELSDYEQGQAFAQCMRDNGVDVPDPDPNGGGGIVMRAGEADREAMQQAMEACRDLMPEGMGPGQMDPEMLEQLREFAQCMRDHGIDVPDPDPNGGGFRVGGGEGGIDPNSPEFQAAMEACQDLLAGLQQRGTGR